jgi:hypothetical protein
MRALPEEGFLKFRCKTCHPNTPQKRKENKRKGKSYVKYLSSLLMGKRAHYARRRFVFF